MKYVVVLCDGMADYPVPVFDGKTPMMLAKKPNMDYLAQNGEVGLVKNRCRWTEAWQRRGKSLRYGI